MCQGGLVVADPASTAHAHRTQDHGRESDGDVFSMDIGAQIEYFLFFMCGVGFSYLGSSGSGSTPLPEHADRLRQKQPAIPMQPAQHAFFKNSRCADDLLSQAEPQP